MVFYSEKVVLHPDPFFVPEVVSLFHLSQLSILPAFFQSPLHTLQKSLQALNVCRALAYYIHHTKSFHLDPRLFVCYSRPSTGSPVSPQRLAKMGYFGNISLLWTRSPIIAYLTARTLHQGDGSLHGIPSWYSVAGHLHCCHEVFPTHICLSLCSWC